MAVLNVADHLPGMLLHQHSWSSFYVRPAKELNEGFEQVTATKCLTTGITGGGLTDLATKVLDAVCKPLSYQDDFYDRIHVIEGEYNLGNVLANRAITWDIWNAWRHESKTMTSFVPVSTVGLEISSGELPPPDLVFARLQIRTYICDISTEGPPQIAAVYNFIFDNGEEPTVIITGKRLSLFPFHHNWEHQLIESLEWKTDVIEADDGTEQRIGVRDYPRMTIKQQTMVHRDGYRQLQAFIKGGYDLPYAIPIWQDQSYLKASASAGAMFLEVEGANRRFRSGGTAAIMHDHDNYEVVTVVDVTGDILTLLSETLRTWSRWSPVFPVELASLQDVQPIKRMTGDIATFDTVWDMSLSATGSALAVLNSQKYKGIYVLEELPNWSEERDITYSAKMSRFDNEVGRMYFEKISKVEKVSQPFLWFLNSRTRIDWYRSLLYYLHGRRVPFWFPTQSPDIRVTDDILADASSFYCYGNYMSQFYLPENQNGIDFRVQLHSGEVYYRQVTHAVAFDSTKDRVDFTNPEGSDNFGRLIKPNQIRLISFMHPMRLEADRVEIAWHNGEFAESKVRVTHTGSV